MAARTGGLDPAMNFRLRLAIDKAREVNMPNANIERAIAAGGHDTKGGAVKEALYEGFGPGGVAILVQAVTDNPNRTSAEIRTIFSKAGGSLGAQHSVGWMFTLAGVVRITTATIPADQREGLLLAAIDAGADDVREEHEATLLVTSPTKLPAVKQWVEGKKLPTLSAQLEFLPTTTVAVTAADRVNLFELLEVLDNHPDVTDIFSNDA